MKSKTNAIMTIAMTYAITRRVASRVLQRDALQHLSDTHAAVGGALERIVHLLPLHDLERVGLTREQGADRLVINGVRFFFGPLDERHLLAHELRLPNRCDAGLDVVRRIDEDSRKLPGRIFDNLDVQHLESARGSVDEVDDIVEARRQGVDVL